MRLCSIAFRILFFACATPFTFASLGWDIARTSIKCAFLPPDSLSSESSRWLISQRGTATMIRHHLYNYVQNGISSNNVENGAPRRVMRRCLRVSRQLDHHEKAFKPASTVHASGKVCVATYRTYVKPKIIRIENRRSAKRMPIPDLAADGAYLNNVETVSSAILRRDMR